MATLRLGSHALTKSLPHIGCHSHPGARITSAAPYRCMRNHSRLRTLALIAARVALWLAVGFVILRGLADILVG